MDENNATLEGQGAGLEFDEYGELKFTESGLEGFKELLKEGVQDNTPPAEEADPEPEPDPEPPKEEPPEPEVKKRKLKVDGEEIEVTEDELVSLAQQGKDYTKKTQQLAEQRTALAPYEALIKQLQTDPNLSQHIATYFQPKQEPAPATPQFDDPIEQLKYETKQEAIAEMRKELQQAVAPISRQQALNQVRIQVQADPDYEAVHKAIFDMVKALPPSIQRNAYMQLDQDPASYLEAFKTEKERIIAGRSSKPPDTTNPPETPPVKKTAERAPILESSNNLPSEASEKEQRAKLDKARKRIKNEGGIDALQSYLEMGGFLNHLK